MRTAARMSVVECPPVLALALIAGACAVSGCAGPLNTESQIGTGPGAWTPPSIGESAIKGVVPAETNATVNQNEAPIYDVTGVKPGDGTHRVAQSLDRSDWAGTVITSPNDLTAHQPRYTNNILFPEDTRRAKGQYPTASSSLDTATWKGNELQMKEALFAPFGAAADIILFIPRFAFEARPDRPTRTGTTPYERWPQTRVIVEPAATIVEPKQPSVATPVPDSAPPLAPIPLPDTAPSVVPSKKTPESKS